MKAVQYHHYGPPEVLKLVEIDRPAPKENEVLIKVHATTVTVADSRLRGFNVPTAAWIPARLTMGLAGPKNTILGAEIAGEIAAVGQGVTRFQPGEQVFALSFPDFGGYVQYKCLPADGVIALKPANLTYEQAAALPVGARTALHYLRKANLQPGDKVLVYGASGSVGTYAVQLAKYFGAEVTGVCSTANLDLVKSLGADHVIDYTKQDFSAAGERYDMIFEAVDKSSFSACMSVLKENGIYINITVPLPRPEMLWAKITGRQTLILGENPRREADDLVFLTDLVEAGQLKPVVDRSYPLEQIVAAHRYVDQGHKKGNVTIRVAHNGHAHNT